MRSKVESISVKKDLAFQEIMYLFLGIQNYGFA